MSRLPTPPGSTPPLILCADGGGSKVCVVIRSEDGLEVRGTAGPCNVQSVGHIPAIQAILLATYRALSLLAHSHLPGHFIIPPLPDTHSNPTHPTTPNSTLASPKPFSHPHPLPHLSNLSLPSSPYASRAPSPNPSRSTLPPLPTSLFQYAWLALAGISTPGDGVAFMPHVLRGLCISEERVKITNDVNLLAAPALDLPGIAHVVAVVCGTGTVGRTIRVGQAGPSNHGIAEVRRLPLEDVAVSRGWGYMLCDEGSAFWLGRLAIRSLLHHSDRLSSSPIHATQPPQLLLLHRDLLAYFGVPDPMDLIELISLTATSFLGLGVGEAVAKRNASVAGAARVVFAWAFPDDGIPLLPTPPDSPDKDSGLDLAAASRAEALRLAQRSIIPLIELTLELLGDQSVVDPGHTALALGGGLMMSKGYRGLLEDGLRREGVGFGQEVVVRDAAGEGARGLARVEFGV